MKTLKKMNINSVQTLKNEELLTLKGGVLGSTFCLCNCKYIIEAWSGCYSSGTAVTQAIALHCGYGSGFCDCGSSC
jgi:hypothetical protein